MDFSTGKYAVFVWPAYGATVVIIAGLAVDSLWRARRWKREADRLQALKDARRKPDGAA